MSFSGFACFTCGLPQHTDYAGYVCPACGGNIEVRYDYDALLKRVSKERLVHPGRPDLFRYAALLPIQRVELAPPLRVGMTPLYPAPRLGALAGLKHLFLKDDGLNPSASFKDRAGAVALVRARETGVKVIAGASTGNAGSSMA